MLSQLSLSAQTITVDSNTEYQLIRGFGGVNMPSWIGNLTTDQVTTAFGNDDGQLGFSILRIKVPNQTSGFAQEVRAAETAKNLGALIMASPWSPPAAYTSNLNSIGGHLNDTSYDDYANYLVGFVEYMESKNIPIEAISIQNEPDIAVDYESCDWTPEQMTAFLISQGEKLKHLNIVVSESYRFDKKQTDTILNNPEALQYVDIIGGHIYGSGLADYPLAREKGKEVWMTEHLNTDTTWTAVLGTGKEINDCMQANFNAYLWWYIRRFYGLLSEQGNITKRGYVMAQYSKFVRPGFKRIAASTNNLSNIYVTAYKSDTNVIVVVVNRNSSSKNIEISIPEASFPNLAKYTTSKSKNLEKEAIVPGIQNLFSVTVDASSVTTFVGTKEEATHMVNVPIDECIQIYPNPAHDKLYINTPENLVDARWIILNQLGDVLYSGQLLPNQQINLQSLAPGIYFIQIQQSNKVFSKKFIRH
jgi:O-glycosyl hydrolase